MGEEGSTSTAKDWKYSVTGIVYRLCLVFVVWYMSIIKNLGNTGFKDFIIGKNFRYCISLFISTKHSNLDLNWHSITKVHRAYFTINAIFCYAKLHNIQGVKKGN